MGCQEVYRLRTRLFAPSENAVLKHDQFDFDEFLKWYLRSITSITIPADNFMRFVVWDLGYTCWKLNSGVESSYVIPFLINLQWFDRSMMYQKNTSESLAFFCLAPMYYDTHCTLVVLENESHVEITDWSVKYSSVMWSNLKRDKTNLNSIGAILNKCLHTFSDFWPPSPLSVRTQTLNVIRNFSAKIRLKISISSTTPPYTNRKKVSQKVKYLLTTFNARGK